jgi:hypothetical protein
LGGELRQNTVSDWMIEYKEQSMFFVGVLIYFKAAVQNSQRMAWLISV